MQTIHFQEDHSYEKNVYRWGLSGFWITSVKKLVDNLKLVLSVSTETGKNWLMVLTKWFQTNQLIKTLIRIILLFLSFVQLIFFLVGQFNSFSWIEIWWYLYLNLKEQKQSRKVQVYVQHTCYSSKYWISD